MAFSSIPFYLDPPNWQHEQANHHQQQQFGVDNENSSQLSPTMLPSPPATTGGGNGPVGLIRSDSITKRVRLAKIIQPETALKCPRCESTNTKFCYFNNYNLSQPRHFCKTCQRYWTRGGALRNIPVGGGCRRNNKRSSSKRTRSPKSLIRSERSRNGPIFTSNSITTTTLPSHFPPPSTHLSFLNTPFHNFNDFNSTQIGLNFGEIQPHESDGRFVDQFRLQQMQQFSFFSPLEQPSNLYPIYSEFGISRDLENVKVEVNKSSTNSQGMNLQRNNNLGVNQFWTDYNISSTSTSQLL